MSTDPNATIDTLGFGTRVRCTLRRLGADTIGQAAALTDDQLRREPNFGRKSLSEFREKVPSPEGPGRESSRRKDEWRIEDRYILDGNRLVICQLGPHTTRANARLIVLAKRYERELLELEKSARSGLSAPLGAGA
jgi:hypothetical protein